MTGTRRTSLLAALVACLMLVSAGCRSGGGAGAGAKGKKSGQVARSDFGKTQDGKPVDLYTLTNKNGLVAKITNYGGILTELHVPDKDGQNGNVVLGFATLD